MSIDTTDQTRVDFDVDPIAPLTATDHELASARGSAPNRGRIAMIVVGATVAVVGALAVGVLTAGEPSAETDTTVEATEIPAPGSESSTAEQPSSSVGSLGSEDTDGSEDTLGSEDTDDPASEERAGSSTTTGSAAQPAQGDASAPASEEAIAVFIAAWQAGDWDEMATVASPEALSVAQSWGKADEVSVYSESQAGHELLVAIGDGPGLLFRAEGATEDGGSITALLWTGDAG